MKTLLAAGLIILGALSSQAADKPVRIDPQAASQNLIKKVEPVLPEPKMAGTVVVDVTISREGKVTRIKVISGSPVLSASVLDAVRQWEYKPFVQAGRPITVITRVEWSFPSLNPPESRWQKRSKTY